MDTVLGCAEPGTLVYCCGPEPLLDAVQQRCTTWPPGSLHVERFAAAPPAEPPAVMQAQIQAAVAAATGSPLAVQLITVLILLAAGFAYFRFLGGKSASFASKAGE